MTWSDVTRPPTAKVVRQFGFLCLAVFGSMGAYQWMVRSRVVLGEGLIGVGMLCLGLALMAPRIFRWFFTGAMLLVFPVGFVVSQVMLALVFYGVFLSVGLVLRLQGVDLMLRRRRPPGASYWEPKPMPKDPRRYLRRY